MRFTPDNFLYAIKLLVTGGGKALSNSTLKAPDGGFAVDDNCLALNDAVLGTGATFGLTSNMVTLSSAASSTNLTVGTWQFQVPRDYDQADDFFVIRVLADMAGATDAPALTITPHLMTVGGTPAVSVPATVVSAALSNKTKVYEFDFSGNSLVRDTLVSFTLTTAVHNTDALQVYGIQIAYRSDLVAYVDTTLGNDPADLAALDASGNPLR